jgi:hypothetical protein
VGGRGQDAAFHFRSAAAWFNKGKVAVKSDFLFSSEALVKIEEIDATAQQDVLAVVDHLTVFPTGGPAGGAAAEEVAGFQNFDFETSAAERRSGSKAGEPAADDDYTRQAFIIECDALYP